MAHVLDILEYTRPEPGRRHMPMSPPVLAEVIHPRRRSRFETLAGLSSKPSLPVEHVVNVLLGAACPSKHVGPAILQPIWTEEAMHRSCTMMQLLNARKRRGGRGGCDQAAIRVEHGVARNLASSFKSLEIDSSNESLPCSNLLRDVVKDLVALFDIGDDVDDITLITNIERLDLPAYKRRALVLAAAELVMNVLLHAFAGRTRGRIEVSLTVLSPVRACLQVKDDGIGFCAGRPDLQGGVAAGLADLLEADLAYYRTKTTTIAEIVFPVAAMRPKRPNQERTNELLGVEPMRPKAATGISQVSMEINQHPRKAAAGNDIDPPRPGAKGWRFPPADIMQKIGEVKSRWVAPAYAEMS